MTSEINSDVFSSYVAQRSFPRRVADNILSSTVDFVAPTAGGTFVQMAQAADESSKSVLHSAASVKRLLADVPANLDSITTAATGASASISSIGDAIQSVIKALSELPLLASGAGVVLAHVGTLVHDIVRCAGQGWEFFKTMLPSFAVRILQIFRPLSFPIEKLLEWGQALRSYLASSLDSHEPSQVRPRSDLPADDNVADPPSHGPIDDSHPAFAFLAVLGSVVTNSLCSPTLAFRIANVARLASSLQGLSRSFSAMLTWFADNLPACVSAWIRYYFPDSYLHEAIAVRGELRVLIEKVLKWDTYDNRNRAGWHSGFQREIRETRDEYIRILTNAGLTANRVPVMTALRTVSALIDEFYRIVDRAVLAGGRRHEPFVVMFYGGTKVGKTGIAELYSLDMTTQKEQLKNGVYHVNPEIKFHENYRGQEVVFIDDFHAFNTPDSTDFKLLMTWKNSAPCELDSASLNDKGSKYMTCKLIVLTSNTAHPRPVGMEHPEAADRRRDLLFEVRVKSQYANNLGHLVPRTVTQTIPGWKDVHEFRRLDVNNIDPARPNVVPISNFMSYDQMLTLSQQLRDQHFGIEHAKHDLIEQHRLDLAAQFPADANVFGNNPAATYLGGMIWNFAGRYSPFRRRAFADLVVATASGDRFDAVNRNTTGPDVHAPEVRVPLDLHPPPDYADIPTVAHPPYFEYTHAPIPEQPDDGIHWSPEVAQRFADAERELFHDVPEVLPIRTYEQSVEDTILCSYASHDTSVVTETVADSIAARISAQLPPPPYEHSFWTRHRGWIVPAAKCIAVLVAEWYVSQAAVAAVRVVAERVFPSASAPQVVNPSPVEVVASAVPTLAAVSDAFHYSVNQDRRQARARVRLARHGVRSTSVGLPAVRNSVGVDFRLDDVMPRFINSVCSFYGYDPDSSPYWMMNVMFISGRIFVSPAHLFVNVRTRKPFAKGDKFVLSRHLNGKTVYFEQYYDPAAAHVIPDTDICFYRCDNNVTCFSDLSKHVPSLSELARDKMTPAILITRPAGAEATCFAIPSAQLVTFPVDCKYDDSNGTIYEIPHAWKYNKPVGFHGKGDCGAPLLAVNASMQRKLLGFHVASVRAAPICYSVVLDKEMVDSAIKALTIDVSVPHVTEVQNHKFLASADARLAHTSVPDGEFLPIGKIISKFETKMWGRSDIERSPIYEDAYPHLTEPAVLSAFDRRLLPEHRSFFHEGISKWGTRPCLFPPRDIEVVRDSIIEDTRKFRNEPDIRRLLTLEEAVGGIPSVPHMDSINKDTSCGFYWNQYKGFGKGKHAYIEFNETSGLNELRRGLPHVEELVSELARAEKRLRRGKRLDIYATPCLKDERRPLKKIPVGKTRVFVMYNLLYVILFRKYFGLFLAAMTASWRESFHAIGIDPYSVDWTFLMTWLLRTGRKGFSGDYPLWDGKVGPQSAQIFIDSANDWYGDGYPERCARAVLLDHVSHSIQVLGDVVYSTMIGDQSGFPATAPYNSFCNAMYSRLAWRATVPAPQNTMVSYKENVAFTSFGDDFWKTVNEYFLQYYNLHTFAQFLSQYNIEVSTADKRPIEEAEPFWDILEQTFLKHSTRIDAPFFKACLEPTTITELTNWVRHSDNPEGMLIANIHDAQRFAYFHTREFYDSFVSKVTSACAAKNIPLSLLHYSELEDWFLGTNRPVKMSVLP